MHLGLKDSVYQAVLLRKFLDKAAGLLVGGWLTALQSFEVFYCPGRTDDGAIAYPCKTIFDFQDILFFNSSEREKDEERECATKKRERDASK